MTGQSPDNRSAGSSIRLPYRLRYVVEQWRIRSALRGLSGTFPVSAGMPSKANTEVHLLLCKRDLQVGLLAIKSLLRHADGELAIAVTDDGTLSRQDREWVRTHVRGVHWWQRREADVVDRLTDRPQLAALYQSDYAPSAKLLHPMLLARCGRVIVMDPDTAFFAPPDRLLAWARGGGDCAWYLHDHQDEREAVPAMVEQAFDKLQCAVTTNGTEWSVRHRLFNSGLLAFRPSNLSLELAERYLSWREGIPAEYRQGKAAIWFGDWTPEQTCYHVMLALSRGGAKPLGDHYHLGGAEGHTFNHFLRHYLVQRPVLKRLRTLVTNL